MSPDEHPAGPAAPRGEVLTAAAQQPAPGKAEPTRGVLCLTFDVDAESVMLAADPANEVRASLMSHQAGLTAKSQCSS